MASSSRLTCVFALALFAIVPVATLGQRQAADEKKLIEFFEAKVRLLLAENCYNCHSANTNSRGGLRVDDRNGLIVGGGRGPAVVPGNPQKSLLIQAVRQTHAEVKMPPKKQLTDKQIADLTRWIKDGAAWPKVHIPDSIGELDEWYHDLRNEHWAWQPLREPKTPDEHQSLSQLLSSLASWMADYERWVRSRYGNAYRSEVVDAWSEKRSDTVPAERMSELWDALRAGDANRFVV